jgi:hypothetical protein
MAQDTPCGATLPGIGSNPNNCAVSAGNGVAEIVVAGVGKQVWSLPGVIYSYSGTPVQAADVQTLTVTGTPTGGTFTLTFKGATTAPIAYNASAATVLAAFLLLPTVGTGNATATGGALPGTPVAVTFAGALANSAQPAITVNQSGLTGGNDVQTVTITGTPTGGTFTLTFNAQTTAAIAYNANAAAVQAALVALPNIGAGQVVCTGGALPGTGVICTFGGTFGDAAQTLMTADGTLLTGGSSPAASVAHTTTGVAASVAHTTTGSGGRLQIFQQTVPATDDAAPIADIDITVSGPGRFEFFGAAAFDPGAGFHVRLASAGAGVVGKVNLLGKSLA